MLNSHQKTNMDDNMQHAANKQMLASSSVW